ncbi:MAG: hydrogenase 4 subunit F, partial [Alistipes sp.]|nr:hydrogenase 4 subunit F [Alistipes sp.]
MILYIVLSSILALAAFPSRSRGAIDIVSALFFAVQAAFVVVLATCDMLDSTSLGIFTFDTLGMVFHALMVVVLGFVIVHARQYLKEEPVGTYRIFFALLMLLSTAITCVYYSNNAALTWIFLEATTICSAGIIYHRHSEKALEATWKYIFVCSTGIAMAYLGILLLCTV